MPFNLNLSLTMTVTIVTLLSCSSSQVKLPSYDELLKSETEQDGRACIRQHRIAGYGALENNVISIDTRGNKAYYLATTWMHCASLQTSFSIGFKGDFSEFCGGGRDQIITSDATCPVKSIFEFKSREDAFNVFEKIKQTRRDLLKDAETEKAD